MAGPSDPEIHGVEMVAAGHRSIHMTDDLSKEATDPHFGSCALALYHLEIVRDPGRGNGRKREARVMHDLHRSNPHIDGPSGDKAKRCRRFQHYQISQSMQWTVDPSQVRHDRAGKGQDHTPSRATLEYSVFCRETDKK